MEVRDRKIKQTVNVCCKECLNRECYWPRPNPGIFIQGKGYSRFGNDMDNEYVCGTREIHGCPDKY